jgi:hypothetical protein
MTEDLVGYFGQRLHLSKSESSQFGGAILTESKEGQTYRVDPKIITLGHKMTNIKSFNTSNDPLSYGSILASPPNYMVRGAIIKT